MEFRDMEYFITIAEEESISRAAKKLFIAQPSLSQFLKNFEASFHCILFDRNAKGVHLTPSGKLVYQTAKRISDMTIKLINDISDVEELKTGTVRFGITSIRAPYLLPHLFTEFHKQYPNIELVVFEKNSAEIENAILQGSIDVAFTALPLVHSDIYYEIVASEEICLAAMNGHELSTLTHPSISSSRPYINLSDLGEYSFVLFSNGRRLYRWAMKTFSNEKVQPKVIHQTNNVELMLRLVALGICVAFIPETYHDHLVSVTLYSIGEVGLHRSLALLYPNEQYRSKATQALSQVIRDIILHNS